LAKGVTLCCGCSATSLGLHECDEAKRLSRALVAMDNVVLVQEVAANLRAHWKADGAVKFLQFQRMLRASRHARGTREMEKLQARDERLAKLLERLLQPEEENK